MSELPAGTAAATGLIIGTCGAAGYAVNGADRVAGQPSRPRLPSPVIGDGTVHAGLSPHWLGRLELGPLGRLEVAPP